MALSPLFDLLLQELAPLFPELYKLQKQHDAVIQDFTDALGQLRPDVTYTLGSMDLPVLFCEIKSGAVGKQKHFNEARQQLIRSAPAPVHALGFRSIHIVFVGFTAWINIYNPFCLPLPPQCALAQDNHNIHFSNLKEFKLDKYKKVIDFVATVVKIMKPLLSQSFKIIPYTYIHRKSDATTYIYQDINVVKIIPISTKEIAKFCNSSIQALHAFQATTTEQSSQIPHSLTISALEPVSPNSSTSSVQSSPTVHNVSTSNTSGNTSKNKEKNHYAVIAIFPFIAGKDLRNLQNQHVESSQIADLFTYLSSLHKKGLVHNDIRVYNIVHNATTQSLWLIDWEYVCCFQFLEFSLIPSLISIIIKLKAFDEFNTTFVSLPINIIQKSQVTQGQFFAVLCLYDIYSLYKAVDLSVDTPKFKECLDTIKESNYDHSLGEINNLINKHDLYFNGQISTQLAPAAD